MKILIEAGIFPENEGNLIRACKSLRVDCALWNPIGYPPYKESDNKVFFIGSIMRANMLKNSKYRYQIWTGDSFDYGNWAGHLYSNILNDNFRILPYGAIKESTNQDKMFIKSNSSSKLVVGDCLTIRELNSLYPQLRLADLLVLSSPKKLSNEYRFIISATDDEFNNDDGRGPLFSIIDNSSYNWDGSPHHKAPQKVIDGVLNILKTNKTFHPYPMWTLDVTLYNDEVKIIEVNSLNCSGLYTINCELLIQEIVRICNKDVL